MGRTPPASTTRTLVGRTGNCGRDFFSKSPSIPRFGLYSVPFSRRHRYGEAWEEEGRACSEETEGRAQAEDGEEDGQGQEIRAQVCRVDPKAREQDAAAAPRAGDDAGWVGRGRARRA